MNVTARAAIDIGNTTEETVYVNETNPVAVEETEPDENTEKKSRIRETLNLSPYADNSTDTEKKIQ